MTRTASPEIKAARTQRQDWILFDGECDFCRRIVTWAGRKDRRGLFTIVPFQEADHPAATPDVRKACERAVHVIRSDGRVLRAGVACLYVAYRLGWKQAKILSKPPFIQPIEAAYRVVADNRHIFSKFFFTKEIE